MSDIAIRVENVSKMYRLGEGGAKHTHLREAMTHALGAPMRWWRGNGDEMAAKAQREEQDATLWALKDVGFEVKKGEVLGIIGRNGAGKSTLLKILSRITEPTTGQIDCFGRIASLLEVGTGFHPELTGRENVYLNGAILGMSKKEINSKFDEIVAFSGVERFIDTPVKRYSSGMGVRLGFAVAAHLEPEILIIDEVLAVGDMEFQNRCIGKMQDVATSGRTVLFVSHNMAAIESLCTSAFLLKAGSIEAEGEVETVLHRYTAADEPDKPVFELGNRIGFSLNGGKPVLQQLRLLSTSGELISAVPLGGDVVFEVVTEADHAVTGATIIISVLGARGEKLFNLHTRFQHPDAITLSGRTLARCILRNCRLTPGSYQIQVFLKAGWDLVDQVTSGIHFRVLPADVYGTGRIPPAKHGPLIPDATWTIENITRPESLNV